MKKLIWTALAHATAALVLVGASSKPASAQQVEARAVAADVLVDGATVHATFKVEVSNKETSPLTNFVVTFDDGSTVALGDIDAGKTVDSDAVSRLIDRGSDAQSKSIPMKVTLSYSIDGTSQSIQSSIAVYEQ